jgi:diacylglycerol O-acyltransferase-1
VLPLFIIASLYIEKQTSKGKFTEKQSLWLHGINLFSVLGVPSLIVHFSHTNPQSGIVFLFLAAILFLKLVSYSLANRDYRRMWLNKEPTAEEVEGVHVDELVSYPDNLTVLDMSYFIVAPTLCYQMNFPRSKSIRWYWLTGKFLQFVRRRPRSLPQL